MRNRFYANCQSGLSLPLDLVPEANIAVSLSLRKLRTAYTGPCCKIKRSSDSTETDVYFDDYGNFSLNSLVGAGGVLSSWIGSSDGVITVWYGQNNTNDAVPGIGEIQIIDSGAIITQNSRPSLLFDGLSYLKIPDNASIDLNNEMTLSTMISFTTWSTPFIVRGILDKRVVTGTETGYEFYAAPDTLGTQWNADLAATYQLSSSIDLEILYSLTCTQKLTTSGTMYNSLASMGTGNLNNTGSSVNTADLLIGAHYAVASIYLDGFMSEFILLNSLASNPQRTFLTSSQINYYNL